MTGGRGVRGRATSPDQPPIATGGRAGTEVVNLLTGKPEVDREIIRGAMLVWASREIENEAPPEIDEGPVQALNAKGLCAYCYRKLGSLPERRLGALICRACAELWAALDDAPEPIPDPLIPFIRRLGHEAARLGLDTGKLAVAIGRARCA
jgi:hypothetical protein